MQTIKTAAIVVLMLTVLYGGYVSMTTPPEPLPEEIEEYLVIDEGGSSSLIDDSFITGEMVPGTADDALSLSQPPAGLFEDAAAPPAVGPSPQPPTTATATEMLAPPSQGNLSLPNTSFADLAPNEIPATPEREAPRALPPVDSAAPSITPGPADSYASTPNQFALPDPSSVAGQFDSSKGTPFAPPAESDSAASSTSANGQAGGDEANLGLTNAIAAADELYQKGQLKEALATLSVFYGMPGISADQEQQLMGRLDPLAREVIYSRRHLLEQPYKVSGSESLVEIAKGYKVPWQLLANINGVDDPVTVLPGTELKMVRGPFRADVDLNGKVMTMFLGDLYAGRFEIEVGKEPSPTPGEFTVQDKQTSRTFYGPAGKTIPAGSPENPYGNAWLDLGGQLCIHGSSNTVKPTDDGCISVAGDLADDVFAILSQGSTVTIRR
ncbi:L,D-transpeptidase family protein [Roseiconus lacunae]|uniref:L,D-transpeptidase family protein n=1 Tax=Roseiconus lacunae TaxID=2605694 RepID=UPI001E570A60|nr:L,D-transpeptidase family protein [Roseiconus lacunae]MCD0462846.1 LysM peptidoglycan-binding domain-containing protein [Roseiconus lacunae]